MRFSPGELSPSLHPNLCLFFCCDFVKVASPLDSLCRCTRWVLTSPFFPQWLTSVICAPDPYQQDRKGDAHHLLRYPQTCPSLRKVPYMPVVPFPSCNSEYPLPMFSCHLSQHALKNSWVLLSLSTIPAEPPWNAESRAWMRITALGPDFLCSERKSLFLWQNMEIA